GVTWWKLGSTSLASAAASKNASPEPSAPKILGAPVRVCGVGAGAGVGVGAVVGEGVGDGFGVESKTLNCSFRGKAVLSNVDTSNGFGRVALAYEAISVSKLEVMVLVTTRRDWLVNVTPSEPHVCRLGLAPLSS